ncbi:Ferrichrome-iron receptor precursor [compost metagenome]
MSQFSSNSSSNSDFPDFFQRTPIVLALQGALLCMAISATLPAMAQTGAPASAAAQNKTFNIAAGKLDVALDKFARASGVNISYDADLLAGLNSKGVNGQYSVAAGLQALLAGTGLEAAPQVGGGYALRKAAVQSGAQEAVTLPAVSVSADKENPYIATRSTSTKLPGTLMETPRAISVVTQEQIRAQAPKTIDQALAYTAGVATDVAGSDVRMSGFTIRGFSDGSAYFKDGLKQLSAGTYASWSDDIDELDSIEVVKGPASVLYGQGRPGGLVNVISKRPVSNPVNSVGISYGTYNRKQINADLGGRLSEDDSLLYRLNITARDADGKTIGSRDDRLSIAPSLLWKISARTRLTLLASYSEERATPKSWWPSMFAYPQVKNLPFSRTAGDPSFDRFDRDTHALGYALEHETDNGWNLSQNVRYSAINVDYRHIYGNTLLADQRTITRANLAQMTKGKTLALDNRAQKDFQWGEVKHSFALGVDYLKYKEDSGLGFGWTVPNLDMLAPVYGQAIAYPDLDKSKTDIKQTGIYTLNQFKWNKWVSNVSLRRDVVRTTQTSTTQPRINSDETTGSVGLLYMFDNGWSPYVSYSTSFDPITGRQFDGSPFKPRLGKQYEAGVKYQSADASTMVTASVFDIYQTNVTTQDPDHPAFSIQTGEVRSTGMELEGKFKLMRELSVMSSYTYLDPRTTQSNRPAEIGRQTGQTNRHMANLWLDYRPGFMPGLMIAGGVRYKGKSPYNFAANGVPNMNSASTIADLAIAYETLRYRLALNISNLTDKKYFAGPFRGAEREALLSLKYYW